MKPLVSICIASYNYAHFLQATLDAALAQRYPHIEVIVSDNGSTDGTFDLLARYADDSRVRLFRNDENVGIDRNFNLAVERATGTFVVPCSADDILLPTMVSDSMALIEAHHDALDVVYTPYLDTDATGEQVGVPYCTGYLPFPYAGGRNEFRRLLWGAHWHVPSLLIRRTSFLASGGFNARATTQGDWHLFLQLAERDTRVGYLPTVGALYRKHQSNYSKAETFVGSAREMHDYLLRLADFANDRNAWRLEGVVPRLIGQLENLWQNRSPQQNDLRFDLACATHRERLRRYATTPTPRPADTPEARLSVIVTTQAEDPNALRDALQSLATQRWRDFEVVLLQHGGHCLEPWIASLGLELRIRYHYLPIMINHGVALILATRLAAGELLCYLAETDRYEPHHLSDLVEALDATGTEAVYSGWHGASGSDDLLVHPSIPLSAILLRTRLLDVEEGSFFPTEFDSLLFTTWALVIQLAAQRLLIPTPHVTVTRQNARERMNAAPADRERQINAFRQMYRLFPTEDHGVRDRREAWLRGL